MNQTDKHFKLLWINSVRNNYLLLNDLSFWDITFDQFYGSNIKLISNNAFGKATETIKKVSFHQLNHSPPEYNVWNVLSSLVNVEQISVGLNITEIPSHAFIPFNGKQFKLKTISIGTPNKITIKKMAFYYLDHLSTIMLPNQIQRIQDEAFAFETKSNKRLEIIFYNNFNDTIIESRSFDGIQRPTTISFNSNVTFIPETAFKSFLNHADNNIKFEYHFINCSDCRNQWLIRDKKDEQLLNATCMHQKNLTLFSSQIRSHFNSNCNLNNSMNYHSCQYHAKEVSFHFLHFIFLHFIFLYFIFLYFIFLYFIFLYFIHLF